VEENLLRHDCLGFFGLLWFLLGPRGRRLIEPETPILWKKRPQSSLFPLVHDYGVPFGRLLGHLGLLLPGRIFALGNLASYRFYCNSFSIGINRCFGSFRSRRMHKLCASSNALAANSASFSRELVNGSGGTPSHGKMGHVHRAMTAPRKRHSVRAALKINCKWFTRPFQSLVSEKKTEAWESSGWTAQPEKPALPLMRFNRRVHSPLNVCPQGIKRNFPSRAKFPG
jgi:hypothetical protein